MFFRFENRPAGQILIHTGRDRGARANMAKHVAAVDDLGGLDGYCIAGRIPAI
jgi:hypothetical protein